MVVDFGKAEILPTGAERFFKTFSRFEFALKESGYLPEKGKAFADWHAFARDLGSAFFAEVRDSEKASTLLRSPPKTQVAVHKILEFKSTVRPNNTQELLEAVCRVRNNLFHGGKSGEPDADSSDPRRNEKLIAEAQWVLELALQHSDAVRYAFEGRY
jgi:hypothetical protein